MNGIRNVLALVLAVVLGALASAANAATPDKLFSVAVNQSVLAAGGTNVPVTVTFTNRSPKVGNSYINTVKLQVPVGVSFTVASVQSTNGNTTSSAGTASPASGSGGTTISISNITGVRPGGTLAVNLLITVTASSCSASAWTGFAWTGNSFNGDSFTPYPNGDSTVAATYLGCDGILPCGASFTKPLNLGAADPGYALVERSAYNKDGASTGNGCVIVPYSFANTLLVDKRTHLTWLVQQTAVFTTSINFPLRPVDPLSGWADAKRPTLAWLTDGSGAPVFVDGQACLGTNPPTNLPAPYGTLQTPLPATGGTFNITISPTGGVVPLPGGPAPFPLVIGTERMTATFLSGTTYAVTRAQGGTPLALHAVGDLVVSTPLPLLTGPFDANQLGAGYAVNNQAQMCVLEYGWTSGGVDASGVPQVYDFTTVIDIGDGWIGQN